MSPDDTGRFLELFLLPNLEECLLDPNYINEALAYALEPVGHAPGRKTVGTDIKTSLRHSVFAFLCDHVTQASLKRSQLRLLGILNRIRKVGSLSRAKSLSPLLSSYIQDEGRHTGECNRQDVQPESFAAEVVKIISPNDREGMRLLKSAMGPGQRSGSPLFNFAIFKRIGDIWPSLKIDWQSSFTESLLDLAVSTGLDRAVQEQANDAAELLRRVELPSDVLATILNNLTPLSMLDKQRGHNPKRRKTNKDQKGIQQSSDEFAMMLRRYHTVLETISVNHPERRPQLLIGLFRVLAELRKVTGKSASEMGYLEILALDNANEIVKAISVWFHSYGIARC